MGGEPTIHPEFKKLQLLFPIWFPKAKRILLTNGTYKESIVGFDNIIVSPILTGKKEPRDPMMPGNNTMSTCSEVAYYHIEDNRVYPCCSIVALTRLYNISVDLISTPMSTGWAQRMPNISDFCKMCSVILDDK